jgi:hypothetical protein
VPKIYRHYRKEQREYFTSHMYISMFLQLENNAVGALSIVFASNKNISILVL